MCWAEELTGNSNVSTKLTDQTNVDVEVARGFGDEWSRFDQSALEEAQKQRIFSEYFAIFPQEVLTKAATGADFGCGSGRWASVVAPRVGKLICVDASHDALEVTRRNLKEHTNCEFIEASIDTALIAYGSLDFGYSLGVLHHVPDTAAGIRSCVSKLRPGAPFLLYLYYSFDNQPRWYRWLWLLSETGRACVSRLPYSLRYFASQVIAAGVYWPLARITALLQRCGLKVQSFPLAYYRDKSFYVMRTDALDRFGTRLEQRFTRAEIATMMAEAGLERITFSNHPPYWCALGYRCATAVNKRCMG